MELCVASAFWLVSSLVLFVGLLIDQLPSVPQLWQSLFRYGKVRVGVITGAKRSFEVPKRWFQHLYIVGVITTSVLLLFFCRKIFLGETWPWPLTSVMQVFRHPASHKGVDSAIPVLLVLVLMEAQVCRRCYETFCVNVFSPTATMTLAHYILGLVYYLSLALSALAWTDFENLHIPAAGTITAGEWITYAVTVAIFVTSSLIQHWSFQILAALRKKAKDGRKAGEYSPPRGGPFELVSCPHFTAEMGVYLSFCVAFTFQHQILLSLFIFVVVNQMIIGWLNLRWYCQHFPGYGPGRYAVFPYIL